MKNHSRIRSPLCILLIMVFALSFVPPSYAEEATTEPQQLIISELATNVSLCDSVAGDQTPTKLREVDPETAATFSKMVLSSARFADFSAQLTHDFPQVFQPQSGQMAHFAYGDKISTVIPIEGGAGYSYYAEWYQLESATLLGSVAGLFTETAAGNIAVKLYIDSQLLFDTTMTPEGLFVEAYLVKDGEYTAITLPDQQEPVSSWWNCFTICLNNNDVPGWVSTLIGIACGALCLVAPTWACQSCMIVLPLIPYFPAVWQCWRNCSPSTHYLPMVQNGAITTTAQ